MEIYKKNAQPPKWALKTIQAGRLRGKTDINPQWRYQALTETFGLCGIGWKYIIMKLWTEQGSNDEITANAEICLYVKIEDTWSEPIPGIGGASFVAKEKNGMYTSDECYKMAVTDALSVACKMLGIGSDIYAGKFDGSKYQDNGKPKLTKQMYNQYIEKIKNSDFGDMTKEKYKDKLFTHFEIEKSYKEMLQAEFDNPLNNALNG